MGEVKEIVVYGKPQGWQRPGSGKYGNRYTPQKTRDYENKIKAAWLEKYGTFSFPPKTPLCIVTMAYFEPPKSWSKKKREAMLGKIHIQTPDRDNIAKCVADGLQHVAFHDDCVLGTGATTKMWDEVARTEIAIWEVE